MLFVSTLVSVEVGINIQPKHNRWVALIMQQLLTVHIYHVWHHASIWLNCGNNVVPYYRSVFFSVSQSMLAVVSLLL